MVNAAEHWFKMELLLYKLGVDTVDPDGRLQRILRAEFKHACHRHTGIWDAFYINGRAVDHHEF